MPCQNALMDASAWDARYEASDRVWSSGPNAFVAAETEDLAPGRVLDLACGEGRNAIWLAQRGWRVTAVDFSRVAVARGRARAGELQLDIEWHVGDVTRWRPDGHFDLVLISYLHLPAGERLNVLESAVEALAPGAIAIVVAHALRNLADGFGGPQDPAVLADPTTIAAEISGLDPDLVIEKAAEVDRHVDTPDGEQTAVDLLVRAHRGLR